MIEKLLEYQTVDGQLHEIEISLAQSDERKKAVAAQAFLKSANDNVARLDAKAADLIARLNALKGVYEKLQESEGDYESVVDTCENVEELTYVKKKAQGLADDISALVENIEALSKEIKSTLDEFAKFRQDTKKANAVYKEFAPKYNELKASKEEDMKKIKAELAAIEKQLPPDAVETYKRLRKEKMFPVLYSAKCVGKSIHCGRCGSELPMAAGTSLKKGELVECDNCHRLLYLDEKK